MSIIFSFWTQGLSDSEKPGCAKVWLTETGSNIELISESRLRAQILSKGSSLLEGPRGSLSSCGDATAALCSGEVAIRLVSATLDSHDRQVATLCVFDIRHFAHNDSQRWEELFDQVAQAFELFLGSLMPPRELTASGKSDLWMVLQNLRTRPECADLFSRAVDNFESLLARLHPDRWRK